MAQDGNYIFQLASDVVVVDEFHHAEATSYRRLLDHVQPIELLGLTATPERGDGVDELKFYKANSVIKNGADTKEVGLTFNGQITVGKFVDRERPTWLDSMNDHLSKVLGDSYKTYGG